MEQLDLLGRARKRGESAAIACTEKAERVTGFDGERARSLALEILRSRGQMSGEQLVEALQAEGFEAHDDRAFGTVFGTLSRRGLIRCVGFCIRKRGNGTAGGRIWALVR